MHVAKAAPGELRAKHWNARGAVAHGSGVPLSSLYNKLSYRKVGGRSFFGAGSLQGYLKERHGVAAQASLLAGMDARRLLARVEEIAAANRVPRKLRELTPLHREVLASAEEYSREGRAISYRDLAGKHGLTVAQVTRLVGVLRHHGHLPERGGWRKEVCTTREQREALYAEHARLLANRVSHYGARHPEAREVVKEAVEAAFDACTLRFNPDAGRFSTYFYRAAANRVKQALSRKPRSLPGVETTVAWEEGVRVPAGVEDAGREEALQAVEGLLGLYKKGLLPERQLLAFLLVHYGGLRRTEAKNALGVSTERVRQLLRGCEAKISRHRRG